MRPDLNGFDGEMTRGVGGTMKRVAGMATAALGAIGVAGAVKAIASIGMTYQDTMNNLQAVSGATQKQMKAVGDTAKQLGADTSLTATSAADAAIAMTELAKGGLTVDAAMKAAKGTLQLASAAGITAAEAATIQSSALNAYSLEADQAGRVSDVLANAANAAAGEIGDFALGMSQASAVAAATGISLEDTAATLGILANNGIKGSDAGTLLKSALLALQSPSGPAAKAMEKLSLSAYDASGNFVGLSSIFGQLREAQQRMTPEAYAAATSTLFGSDAARLAGIAGKEGAEGFDAMRDAMGRQGSAADVAAAKAKGVRGSIEALKSQLETYAIVIYEKVAPAVEAFIRGLTGSLDNVIAAGGAVVDFVKRVYGSMEPFTSWVRDNMTPILAGLAGALAVIATPAIISAIGALAAVLGGALLGALGFLLSPIGLIALAVGGLVGTFTAAYNASEPLRNAVQDLKDAFDIFLAVFKGSNDAGGIQGFFDGIQAGITYAGPLIKSALADIGSALWTWIEDNIGPALAALGRWIAAIGDWIWNTGLPILRDAAKALGTALWDWIQPMIGPALAQLGEWLAALAAWIWNTGLPWLWDALVALGDRLQAWIGPMIGPMLSKIGEFIGALVDWFFTTGIPWVVETLWDLAGKLIDWIVPMIPGLLGNLAEFVGRAVGWLLSTGIQLLIGAMLKISWELVTWVLPRLPDLLWELLKFFGKVVAWIFTDALPMLFKALWEMGSGAIKGLWESISNSPLVQKMTDIFTGLVDSIGRAWDGLTEKLKTPLRAVVNFVNDKVIDNLNVVTKKFGLEIPRINNRFATGGIVPGGYSPGRDNTIAAVGSGEAIMRPEWTRAVGADYVHAANAAARTGGVAGVRAFVAGGGAAFARGGIVDARTGSTDIGGPWDFAKNVGGKIADGAGNLVDAAGNVVGSVKEGIGNAVSWAGDKIGDLVAKGVGFALDKIIRPVGNWIADNVSNPFISDFTRGIVGKTADSAKKWGDDRQTAQVADPAAGGFTGGGTPAGDGTLGSNWASLFATIKAQIPQARLNSGARNSADAHGRGKAVDFGFGTGPGGNGSAGLASIARLLYTKYGRNLYELIYTGIGDNTPDIKNSRNHVYNAATNAQHKNHVHAAVYDEGGVLAPGLTLVNNKSGKPEAAITNDEWQVIRDLAANGKRPVVVEVRNYFDGDEMHRLVDSRITYRDDIEGVNMRSSRS